jgi:integrase
MKLLSNTKATVRIRKAEDRKEWYLYIESYPVIVDGKATRVRQYLNRSVTTIEWDKKRTARTEPDGSKTYKPKRDDNGLIICKSEVDRASIVYADGIRALRQKEFDNAELYTDDDNRKVEAKQKAETNFILYFEKLAYKRNKNRSESILLSWLCVYDYLKKFGGETLLFANLTESWCEDFKEFLLTTKSRKSSEAILAQNTAVTYYSIFKAALKKAFVDGYLTTDLSAKTKGIKLLETRREFLTIEELNKLAETPCNNPTLKKAALFSALTGLRLSDVQKLTWKELVFDGSLYKINFTQKKTKGVEYMPISEQAFGICGEKGEPNALVFEKLPDSAWISSPLKHWVQSAGINKKITFHCFRHTFATLQLTNGTDIYTVSKMLGHKDLKVTQIYAKIVDETKQKAANTIKINTIK